MRAANANAFFSKCRCCKVAYQGYIGCWELLQPLLLYSGKFSNRFYFRLIRTTNNQTKIKTYSKISYAMMNTTNDEAFVEEVARIFIEGGTS